MLLRGQSKPENAPLVNLNVTAVDGTGQPVAGLREEDFQILDNGKPRKILWFRAVSRSASPASLSDDKQRMHLYFQSIGHNCCRHFYPARSSQ
jgi:hypothetical protein